MNGCWSTSGGNRRWPTSGGTWLSIVVVASLGLWASAGCGSDLACVPGIQDVCACPGTEVGAQACNAEGTGFDECVCAPAAMGGGDEGGGSVGGDGGSAPGGPGQPPPPPMDAPLGDGSTPRILGVTHLFIGTKTVQGVESANAWEAFGYNIDGQVTTTDFSQHCKSPGGAPSSVFPDAPDGVDNAFGHGVLPVLKTLFYVPDLEVEVNEAIEIGFRTSIFDLFALGPEATYSTVGSSFFEGRFRSGSSWLKAPASFTGNEPKLQFPDAYLTDDVWVSRRVDGVLTVTLEVEGLTFPLALRRPLVTAELTPDHGSVTRGMISGVLDTEEFVKMIRVRLAQLDTKFCSDSTVQGIMNQFRQASDIMNDGTQSSAATCNGISVGLGFIGESVAVGGVGPSDPPEPDVCAE